MQDKEELFNLMERTLERIENAGVGVNWAARASYSESAIHFLGYVESIMREYLNQKQRIEGKTGE